MKAVIAGFLAKKWMVFLMIIFYTTAAQSEQNSIEGKLNSNQLNENQIYIESDSMQYDDQNSISTYLGNVYAKQISRELFGEKMLVSYNADRSVRQIEVFGNPAKYQQTETEEQEAMIANANYIKYLKDQEILELKESVYLDKADFKSSAENLTYNINSGEVRAESGRQKRVEMILN